MWSILSSREAGHGSEHPEATKEEPKSWDLNLGIQSLHFHHPSPHLGHARRLDREEEREAVRGPEDGLGLEDSGEACHAQSWAE